MIDKDRFDGFISKRVRKHIYRMTTPIMSTSIIASPLAKLPEKNPVKFS